MSALKKKKPVAVESGEKIISHKLLKSWSPCIDGYQRFCKLFPEGEALKKACEGLVADGHESWAHWLFNAARNSGEFKTEVAEGFLNSGDQNSGHRNSGHQNSGHWNSGHRNSGDQNSGHRNSGHQNSGDQNSGDQNSGHQNSGHQNSGHQNSGHQNSGHRNSGHQNSGDQNSGDQNSGHRNSGHWNSGHRNSGHFNTSTPSIITVFNKPCDANVWENAYKPSFLYFDPTVWIYDHAMTDQEKIDNPKFFTAGGYLKKLDFKEAFKASWERADKKNRERVRELPNFDADLFFEISGIDLRQPS